MTSLLTEAVYLTLTGTDGVDCPVWRNPTQPKFVRGLGTATHSTTSLRGMLTRDDLFVWQGSNMLHGVFMRQTGIEDGIRLGLRVDRIEVNDEVVVVPEAAPWAFDGIDPEHLDTDQRRTAVEACLRGNQHLQVLYPRTPEINWYA